MFDNDLKYEIELPDSRTMILYGIVYFGDKPNFWRHHQSMLTELYNAVLETGFPVKVTDVEDNSVQIIDSQKEFDVWITTTQPFEIKDRGN